MQKKISAYFKTKTIISQPNDKDNEPKKAQTSNKQNDEDM